MALELAPGQQWGPFEILEVVGTGAFAWVYKVNAPGHQRPVALKLSIDPVTQAEVAQRALREIAVLRSLTNPHVVRVHDSGMRKDGHIYILMDYLEGAQLNHAHDFDEPMKPEQAVTVIHQACMGLAEAHSAGIVHRDIKPENIWVERDGTIKVLDFGLARAWDNSAMGKNVTVGRVLIGTPHYSQPEQLQTGQLTPAGDVYSLAILLYELLSGYTPFFPNKRCSVVRDELMDEPIQWLAAHAQNEPYLLTKYKACKKLPQTLVDIVMQALSKDPTMRPPDAGVFANTLGSILHHDMGVVMAATLRVTHPYGGHEDKVLLPGSHRIGSGERCEVRLPSSEVQRIHAILEWRGLPMYPQLRPLRGDGSVQLNDRALHTRAQLSINDHFTVGPYRIDLFYPKGGS